MQTFSRLSVLLAASTLSAMSFAQQDGAGRVGNDPNIVAVLPFENLSTRPDAAAWIGALYDEVWRAVSQQNGIYVVGREAVAGYLDSKSTAREIADELGAGSLLEASVEDDGEGLRISVYYEAIGYSRGSSSFNHRDGDDSTELAAAIARSLQARLSIRPVSPLDVEATLSQRIAEAHAIILDSSRPEAERYRALYQLPFGPGVRDAPFAIEARSGAVAVAAAQMAQSSPNARIRAGVWRAMDGVPDPNLLQPLLHSVANDSDRAVRAAAARILRTFLDQPGVRGALENARDNDPTVHVRNEARLALLPDDAWSRLLEQTALDTSLSDYDRASILVKFYDRAPDSKIVPADFALTIWEFSLRTSDARAQTFVWDFLRGVHERALIEPLLNALTNDSRSRVRASAAELLTNFRDDARASEALQSAERGDSTRIVRREAGR